MQHRKKDSLFGAPFVQARGKSVTNWRSLVGLKVQIWRGDEIVDQGVVEAVTSDGSVVWLTQTGAVERRMVVKERGAGIRIQLIN
ncbi:hypothetical protein HAV21_12150 [Paenarthrobacter sp. MSM-2-10-13]|nr:hypothetical protein [Paenarthrobacter sp. MSM-2-10-13]NHW47636.1 hypothetical protein [Paenarthrobacter sp. MSM-2-10-13]TQS93542.1 hypothetical protein EU811_05325 [Arthrobacter sp. TS-15]BCW65053.1 hypothetical protein StoSoilB22_40260 [Arthrobacter sp. StoSoilB22]